MARVQLWQFILLLGTLLLLMLWVGPAGACSHSSSTGIQPRRCTSLAFQATGPSPHGHTQRVDTRLWWGLFGGDSKDKGGGASGGGKSAARSVETKNCKVCAASGAVPCRVCGGSGIDKKNGNVFERYKCMACQGFGLVSCPTCNPGGGLTPEQRGER